MRKKPTAGMVAALALLCQLAQAPSARAQDVDVGRAATVKAGYLVNFIRYTQWPDGAFEKPDSPIVLTLVGNCDLEKVLPEVVARSEPFGNRGLELQSAHLAPDGGIDDELLHKLDRSHLVYCCSLSPELVRGILERVSRSKALTVGDMPDFADHGGMLGFVLREGRIVFEANPTAIQSSEIAVSAKVLKLATIVGGTP